MLSQDKSPENQALLVPTRKAAFKRQNRRELSFTPADLRNR
jgi:hypothetical protein